MLAKMDLLASQIVTNVLQNSLVKLAKVNKYLTNKFEQVQTNLNNFGQVYNKYLFLACDCNADGSDDNNCDASTGQCTCQDENIVGRTCDETPPGYYDFPTPKGMKLEIPYFHEQFSPLNSFRSKNSVYQEKN